MRKYNLSDFAKLIKDIQRTNRDALVVFSGFSGEGKTTFASHLGNEVSTSNNMTFSYKNNMAIGADDFLE